MEARDLEAGEGLKVPKRLIEPAGVHFCSAPAAFALEMMVVVPGVAADEPHDLIDPEDALSPALPHEALEVPVDRG